VIGMARCENLLRVDDSVELKEKLDARNLMSRGN